MSCACRSNKCITVPWVDYFAFSDAGNLIPCSLNHQLQFNTELTVMRSSSDTRVQRLLLLSSDPALRTDRLGSLYTHRPVQPAC